MGRTAHLDRLIEPAENAVPDDDIVGPRCIHAETGRAGTVPDPVSLAIECRSAVQLESRHDETGIHIFRQAIDPILELGGYRGDGFARQRAEYRQPRKRTHHGARTYRRGLSGAEHGPSRLRSHDCCKPHKAWRTPGRCSPW